MNNNLIIKDMTLDDIDEIMKIESVSFPTPWPKSLFQREIKYPKAYIKVLKEGSSVLGYIATWIIYDEVHILNIAIHPGHRRKGYAELLINDCINHFNNRDIRLILLEVRVNNIAAIKLYEKLGFKEVLVRKKYYSDTGEDAKIMIFDLNEAKSK